jgi:hypothetical protein
MDCRCCDWFLCKICSDYPEHIRTVRIPTCGFYADWSSDNYEMVAEPIDEAVAARQELAMLEMQERRLQDTLAQRRRFEGAKCEADDVSSILAHYQSILEDVQKQMVELSPSITLIE